MEEQAGSSTGEQAGSSSPKSRRSPHDGLIKQLAKLQSTLTDLLRPIDDDARLMDASLEDAHKLVQDIRSVMKQKVFGRGGPLDPSAYKDTFDAFERARVDENDMYEVYADDLERYEKRRRKDLGLAESDSDKLALVQRRRVYIPKLLAFQAQVSAILNYLRKRPSRP
jgi:hypothetical protein